ncbi:hypothetical protein Y048_3278 [Burkholderia pseudomallei MSHR456]|nr:hypothetical protein Y048_3278 [Burkholderia pseudomallei MSHR456]
MSGKQLRRIFGKIDAIAIDRNTTGTTPFVRACENV